MALRADDVDLMLAEPRLKAFTSAGWYFELKFDGFRLLAERIGGRVRLVLRRGREATALFPEVVAALAAMPGPDFIIDGEVVMQDEAGKPVFQKLLTRSTLTNPRDIEFKARTEPAVFFGFDLLRLADTDTRPLPLSDRKQLLAQLMPKNERLVPVDHVEGQGEALLEAVRAQGLEGIMCKKASAPYSGGRGENWLKVAFTQVGDFAVVGYAEEYGALYLATWNGEGLTYAGKVGAGFNPKVAAQRESYLGGAQVKVPQFELPPPGEPDARWVTPSLVVEVRYKNWPAGLSPREPVFLRWRDDKRIDECPPPPWAAGPSRPAMALAAAPELPLAVPISNPSKVYFPQDGITKREVCAYYQAVAPWLLPYLVDRPLMVTRYPDGIGGKSFFQRAKPAGAPEWVRSVHLRNEEEARDIDQVVCDSVGTLVWCANMGSIPLHIPASRLSHFDRADWASIDFDPKEAPFLNVVTLALGLHSLCREVGLPTFVKTSGSSGLHVLIPLAAQVDHAFARMLAQVLTAHLVKRFAALATVEHSVSKRAGKVYLDTSSNGQGKQLVAPFAIRPLPGAPVSMPLEWHEVTPELSPRRFTIRNAVERLERNGDRLADVLTLQPDLAAALASLSNL